MGEIFYKGIRERTSGTVPLWLWDFFSRFASVGLKRYCDASKNAKLAALEDAVREEDDTTGVSLYFLVCIMVQRA